MNHYKLRIKDPSGAEFEAEGPAEFISTEKESFLKDLRQKTTAQGSPNTATGETPSKARFWDRVTESGGDQLRLKIKSPKIGPAEAALTLIAANRAVNQTEAISAITLSKALKTSGYEPARLDRLLSTEIREGRITASGTKRNRTYQITQKGLEKAYKAIQILVDSGE